MTHIIHHNTVLTPTLGPNTLPQPGVIAVLLALFALALTHSPLAHATDIPLPDQGLIANATTTHLDLHYTAPLGPFQSTAGLRTQLFAPSIATPFGLSHTWLDANDHKYALITRAEISPLLLLKDQTDFGLSGDLSIQNHFLGRYLSGLAGIQINAATALTALPDHRHRYLLFAGAGHHFDAFALWLTGRTGLTLGGVGDGALYTELGLTLSIPFSQKP